MTSLFHYTSNEGALGIIESQCLYATHFRYLNDASELSLTRDVMVPIFTKELKAKVEILVSQGRISPDFLTEHGTNIYRDQGRLFYDLAVSSGDNICPVYLTSFCQHEEGSYAWQNGLLSQWRGYGLAGGCAFDFESDGFKDIGAQESDVYSYAALRLANVRYEKHNDYFDIDEITQVAKALAEHALLKASGKSDTGNEDLPFFAKLWDMIFKIGPTLKHAAFKEEDEVRIIAAASRMPVHRNTDNKKRKHVHYRFRNGMPIPYIKLFEEAALLPIKRIMVGPQRNQEQVAYAIKLALENKNLNVEILLSDTSYVP